MNLIGISLILIGFVFLLIGIYLGEIKKINHIAWKISALATIFCFTGTSILYYCKE
jgi:hypothetical protein